MGANILSFGARKVMEEVKERAAEGMEALDSAYRGIKELLMEDYDTEIFSEYCKLSEKDRKTVIIARESEGKSLYPCKDCGSLDCIGHPPSYVLLSQEQKKQVNEWKEYIRRLDKERGIDWKDDIL